MSMNPLDTTVLKVVNSKMCTGCGLCEPLCPVDAIRIDTTTHGLNEPIIDLNLCTHCTFCLDVCGRNELNYEELQRFTFGDGPSHPYIGHHLSCYRGHAENHSLRWKATAGGAITALLKFAFDTNMIDAAIVTGPDPDEPTMTSSFVARNSDEVSASGGSRYAPSSVLRCLKEALEFERIAIVGLPCQFESLRKVEVIQKRLRNKIVLRLGVFCSHNVSLLATEFVYRRWRLPKKEIADFRYRGNGWPGGITAKTNNGVEHHLPNQNSLWTEMFMAFIFAAPYCSLCTDHTSELADLSFGDAWLPEIMNKDRVGESVIISRSAIGQQLLSDASAAGVLQLSELSTEKVVESQLWPLYYKKRLIHSKRILLADKRFDQHGDETSSVITTDVERRISHRAWFNSVNSGRSFMPRLLSWVPVRFIRLYARTLGRALAYHAHIWFQGEEA